MKNLSFKSIVEKRKDISGKWYVRVSISDDKSIFLKFNHNPTSEEIKKETLKYIENQDKNKENELKRIDRLIEKLQKTKKILTGNS